ncbi:MAG: FAD-binding oxidoreductase [Vicinamibacterales bacterium]
MPALETATDIVARYLEDAAHYPGGRALGVMRPRTVEEVAACLRGGHRVLPVGAQSSLTGGATPMGDFVISTERLTHLSVTVDRVRAGAGVPLQVLQDTLKTHQRWFPPVPTYLGAFVGGAVATGAAGAATFKYGTVREWVDRLTIVLAGGDVLEIARGQVKASAEGTFEIETSTGLRTVRVPAIHMPDVPKRSAGYFAAPGMDLVDLFIGSEGTLGVIVEAVLRTAPLPAATCHALVPVVSEAAAIALVDELRRHAGGIGIAAIEHIDERSIGVIREDGVDRKLDVTIPATAGAVLLVEIELTEATPRAGLWRQLESARDADAPDTPLVRFCGVLERHHALDDAEVALPDDQSRAAAFAALREAVPAGVNRRVGLAQHRIDARIAKTAADMIVPFDRFAEMMLTCRRLCRERDLDLAVWGHISDGNVHPNVIPRSAADVDRGREAILALGREVIAMGGCPLAEHGVGKSPAKQQLLALLYGEAGVAAMRAVKRALDPRGELAPGVIFPDTLQ